MVLFWLMMFLRLLSSRHDACPLSSVCRIKGHLVNNEGQLLSPDAKSALMQLWSIEVSVAVLTGMCVGRC